MRLKLDENLSTELVTELAALGHDAATCIKEGIAGSPDAEVAAHANREARMLVTLDLDFSDLRRYPPGTHPGIVVMRLHSQDVVSCSSALRRVFAQISEEDLCGNLAIVEESRVRIRKPETP